MAQLQTQINPEPGGLERSSLQFWYANSAEYLTRIWLTVLFDENPPLWLCLRVAYSSNKHIDRYSMNEPPLTRFDEEPPPWEFDEKPFRWITA